jgi:uncharacterized protein
MNNWTPPLLMGLAGSLHCAGMCSPLAMALTKNKSFLASNIGYNSGRILVYALLGTIASSLGALFNFGSFQQVVSILLGILFLLVGLGFGGIRLPYAGSGISWFSAFLKKSFSKVLQHKSSRSSFLLGMINGLLPCGLTYMALSACLILPGAVDGFLFMIYFGLGTWPIMFGITRLFRSALLKNSFQLSRLYKFAMVFIGCMLLFRAWGPTHHEAQQVNPQNPVVICE